MIRIRVLPAIPYPGVVLALCVVTTLTLSLLSQGMGVLYPFIQKDLDISRAQLGLIASGQIVGTSATVMFTGLWADVIGARRLRTAALIGVAVGLLLFSMIQSVAQGILVGVLIGVAFSGSGPTYTKAIMDWIARRVRAMAMGLTEAAVPVGGIVAAGLLTFLAVTYGWRTAVIVTALITGVSGLIFFVVYRDKPGSYTATDKMTRPARKLPQVLGNPNIWMGALAGTTLGPVQHVLAAYLVLFLKEYLDMSAGAAGGLLAILMAGGAVGRLGWGVVSDLLLQGRRVGILAIVSVMAVASMVMMALLPSDVSFPVVAVLIFAMGCVTLGRSGVYVVFMVELAGPALTGTTMGFHSMISNLTAVGIIPLFGLIADQTESYAMSWWMMAAFSGVGILMLAMVGKRTGGR